MTDYVITSNVIVTSADAEDLAQGDSLYLAQGIIISAATFGIAASNTDGEGVSLSILGAVRGGDTAIELQAGGANIAIGAGGSVTGFSAAITVGFDSVVSNAGTVIGQSGDGIFATDSGQNIANSGYMFGTDAAVYLQEFSGDFPDYITNSGTFAGTRGIYESAAGNVYFTNSGTVSAYYGVVLDAGAGNVDTIDNTGVIAAPGGAILQTGAGTVNVTNSGHISGAISFDAGNDTYDGTLGSILGAVAGNAGNDTLIGGEGRDVLNGGSANDILWGNGGADKLIAGPGNDTIDGGSGNDQIVMNSFLTAKDQIDGGTGNDTVFLDGDYSAGIVFGATTMVNVETISLAAGFGYRLTTDDATVAAGKTLTVDASALSGGATLFFDGSAETDGHFDIVGGASANTMTGGDLSDTLTGGAGVDTFKYLDPVESTSTQFDLVVGFNANADRFDFDVAVGAVDATVASGRLSMGAFDADLAGAVGAGQLAAGHAVLFTPTAGSLHGDTFLIVDANGVAGYQAGQDYVIELVNATHLASLSTADFI
ncbi:MAG TPA: calcium-binding protein [Rhizomicrobium sp.]|nr:calcium-binding protein [Rhizomicrobium sp.]